jgi:hypothetical protein
MALLVDGSVSQNSDLVAYDSGVQTVASVECIDLSTKLAVALAEIEEEVENFLRWEETGTLGQVRVSLALKHWHILKTLEAVYRDAYFSQLNDRFKKRWKHYRRFAAEEEHRNYESGVELVTNPVNRPTAVTVTVGDGTIAAATYWVQATVLDGSGRESAPSAVQVVVATGPHSLTVSLATVAAGVATWNVYVGTAEGALALQTSTPLAVAVAWTLPDTGLVAGAAPGTGQAADSVVRRTSRLRS